MKSRSKALLVIGLTLALVAGVTLALKLVRKGVPWAPEPIVLEGSVLAQNADPSERTPLADVQVTAVANSRTVKGKSGPTGYFNVILNPGVREGQTVILKFQKRDFKDSEITATRPGDQLYIMQMEPVLPKTPTISRHPEAAAKIDIIKNIRVRYTSKDSSTISVGSIAKQFAALNTGNVPCRSQPPCSPDGKWRATRTTLPLDAEPGNEFRNLRVSCIAGPCHFTRIDSAAPAAPASQIKVSVLNWSDATDFLVEADVIRTMTTDIVRQSYPFVLGDTMNFAMPSNAKGLSIEADLSGSYIVFPLGPQLLLSWAACSKEVSEDGNQLYRCRLKPGYRFQ